MRVLVKRVLTVASARGVFTSRGKLRIDTCCARSLAKVRSEGGNFKINYARNRGKRASERQEKNACKIGKRYGDKISVTGLSRKLSDMSLPFTPFSDIAFFFIHIFSAFVLLPYAFYVNKTRAISVRVAPFITRRNILGRVPFHTDGG